MNYIIDAGYCVIVIVGWFHGWVSGALYELRRGKAHSDEISKLLAHAYVGETLGGGNE